MILTPHWHFSNITIIHCWYWILKSESTLHISDCGHFRRTVLDINCPWSSFSPKCLTWLFTKHQRPRHWVLFLCCSERVKFLQTHYSVTDRHNNPLSLWHTQWWDCSTTDVQVSQPSVCIAPQYKHCPTHTHIHPPKNTKLSHMYYVPITCWTTHWRLHQ